MLSRAASRLATAAAARACAARPQAAVAACSAVEVQRAFASGVDGGEQLVRSEVVEGGVGLVTLSRPKALNALNDALMSQLIGALAAHDADPAVGACLVTGEGKAWAAGADIKEMAPKSFADASNGAMLEFWDKGLAAVRKPVVAAVHGVALGGGCELMMMCDIAYAAEGTRFGQPEITLGTIPGAGGTQRLTRAVGKSLAMEMILANRWLDADEALRVGLVSKVLAKDELLPEALGLARKMAAYSQPAARLAKECVNAAYETPLQEGLRLERRCFHATFALADQKEGMGAFAEKREPNFTHK